MGTKTLGCGDEDKEAKDRTKSPVVLGIAFFLAWLLSLVVRHFVL